jgi:hypothetical protein
MPRVPQLSPSVTARACAHTGAWLAVLAVMLCSLAAPAHAGPWPREKGEGFVATALDADARTASDPFLSLYAEYGLGKGRTLGLDRYQNEHSISKSIVFLRWPLIPPDTDLRVALEFGGGVVDGHPALRPGLSFGKGFEWGAHGGWFSVESRAVVSKDILRSAFESDATLGWALHPKIKTMVQLQASAPLKSDPHLKLAPSLVYTTSETRSLTLGITAGVMNNTDLKLRLGLWHRF